MKNITHSLYCLILIIVVSCSSNGCSSKNDYLLRAELAASYDCVDSLSNAWDYLYQANKETNKVVGVDIAKTIFHKADSLLDQHLQKRDLDSAARCIDIMGRVISYYGKTIINPGKSGGPDADTNAKLAKLNKSREQLADLYNEQARSAENLWRKYNDPDEQRLWLRSDSLAHVYNPNKY